MPIIPLDTEPGARLLEEAVAADYGPLAQHYESQELVTFCGVASGVVTLNALRAAPAQAYAQSTFLARAAASLSAHVRERGMTLEELGGLLGAHGARVSVHYAGDETVDGFRAIASRNVSRDGDFLIVNYLREAIGQSSGGHFSPLAAYHAATDRFLILDTADYKYAPVWVETDALFAAMATVDASSGKSRGFVAVES
jgi:hypothetical protein